MLDKRVPTVINFAGATNSLREKFRGDYCSLVKEGYRPTDILNGVYIEVISMLSDFIAEKSVEWGDTPEKFDCAVEELLKDIRARFKYNYAHYLTSSFERSFEK